MSVECIICYENVDRCFVKCSCNTCVCDSCMKDYMENTSKEINKLPTCPLCYSEFIGNMFNNSNLLNEYIKNLLRYLKNNPSFISLLNTKIKNERIIAFLRDSKQKYDDLFPKAILEMFRIIPSLKLKYEAALKINQDRIRDKILETVTKKKCYSGICNTGYLYVNYDGKETCNACNLIFCDICDKEYMHNHQCKREDIDSVAFLKTIAQCPTCNTSIEKTEGCDYMTCLVCKTKFNLLTGELTGTGSYNVQFDRKKYKYNLITELNGKYSKDILNIIRNFENQTINDYVINDLSIINKPIEEIDNNELMNFFYEYSNYRFSCKIKKEYSMRLLKIRQLHIDGKLNYDNLLIALNEHIKE